MKKVQLISKNLRQINLLYKKILASELSVYELDQHYEVLWALSNYEEPITQNKLAELLQIDKSRMVNIIFYLEQKELILIKRNPADRREHYVYLSPSAKKSVQHIEHTIDKINKLAEDGIEEEKLNTFFEVSEMIQRNLLKRNNY